MTEHNSIEITINDLAKANAEVLTREPFVELLEKQPMMMLLFTVYGVELTDVLFKKEKEKK